MYLHNIYHDVGERLQFEWHAAKAAANLAKHGVSFGDATKVWLDPRRLEITVDGRAEPRALLIGVVDGVALTVVHTVREDHIRIISARPASRQERRRHAQVDHQP